MSHDNMVHKVVSFSNEQLNCIGQRLALVENESIVSMLHGNQQNNTPCWSNTIATITFSPHIRFGFLHQWKTRFYTSSTRGMKIKTLSVSWFPREKFRNSAEDRWLNHTFTSGASEGKTSTTCTKHNEDCKVGAEDWLAQNFELSNDFTLAKLPYLSDSSVSAPSTNEGDEEEPTNVTNCPGLVH